MEIIKKWASDLGLTNLRVVKAGRGANGGYASSYTTYNSIIDSPPGTNPSNIVVTSIINGTNRGRWRL